MATQNDGIDMTFLLEGATTIAEADRYEAVKLDAGGAPPTVTTSAANTDAVLGYVQETGDPGESVRVRISGISKALCGGTVTAGNLVMPGTGAGILDHVAAGGNTVCGQALQSGAAGEVVEIRVFFDYIET